MTEDHQTASSSRRDKVRPPSLCLSACFTRPIHNHEPLLTNSNDDKIRTPRSPYQWLKTTATDLPRTLKPKRRTAGRWRNHYSADFSYDASSYALNFEDDRATEDDRLPFRDFTARLSANQRCLIEYDDWSTETSSPTYVRRTQLLLCRKISSCLVEMVNFENWGIWIMWRGSSISTKLCVN